MSERGEHRTSVGNHAKRSGSRVLVPAGAIAVLILLLFGMGAAAGSTAPQSPPNTVLATVPLADTVAANTTNVFAQGAVNCSYIWSINTWGAVSVYASVPVGNATCDEGALALAPSTACITQWWSDGGAAAEGLGSWGHHGHGCHPCGGTLPDILYDVVAGVLYQITQGGSNVTAIATFAVPNTAAENLGLTYDQVGTFHHDLIVTSSSGGKIWLVNSTGNVTLLAHLGTYIGGPAVAPMSFGSYGGDLLVAVKKQGHVDAITPSGNVSVVTNWTDANAVSFAGNSSSGGWGGGGNDCGHGGCSFGRAHYVMFVANYSSGAIEAFPASDFSNYSGQGFIAGGVDHGIASFTSSGATTLFAANTERLADLAFISCFDHSSHGGHGGGGGGGWGGQHASTPPL